jgi:hypothetical protein
MLQQHPSSTKCIFIHVDRTSAASAIYCPLWRALQMHVSITLLSHYPFRNSVAIHAANHPSCKEILFENWLSGSTTPSRPIRSDLRIVCTSVYYTIGNVPNTTCHQSQSSGFRKRHLSALIYTYACTFVFESIITNNNYTFNVTT